MKHLIGLWLLAAAILSAAAPKLIVPGSLTAHFVHTASGNGIIERNSGEVTVNRSRAFVADLSRPSRQKVCNYRSDVQWIDYGSRTVVRYRVGSLLDLMQIYKVARHYRGSYYKSNYHGYHFLLHVNGKGQVDQLSFRDKRGAKNTIRLSRIRYDDRPQPASKFRCKVPASFRIYRGKI